MDLATKFNRGMIIALIKTNIYEAVQMYREYISYLKTNGFEEELIITRNAFLTKLSEFALNKENIDKYSQLIPAYQELMVAFPDNDNIKLDCAECFNKLEQYDIALEILKDADQNSIAIKKKIAEIAHKHGDLELAIKIGKIVCEKEPLICDNFCFLGICHLDYYLKTNNTGYLKEAILNMETAHKMAPYIKLYVENLVSLYTRAKEENSLKQAWDKLLKFKDFNVVNQYNYAAYLLRHGDFIEGFKQYQCRFEYGTHIYAKLPDLPIYNGKQDLAAKHLLILHEQGFGDMIMFSRFIRQLKAKKITIGAPAAISGFIKRNFPDLEVTSNLVSGAFDYQIPIASLPYILKTTKDNIPCTNKYLFADEKRVEEFKKQYFNTNEFKIGICYKGIFNGPQGRDLDPKMLDILTQIPNTKVYSLQFNQQDSVFDGTKIINMSNKIMDFDDSAAMIDNMDLMVTTDNVNLNLAGALGKKTFGLFNFLQEYRWFDLSGDDVKWYNSVKAYQCENQNEWEPVIKKVAQDVQKLVQG